MLSRPTAGVKWGVGAATRNSVAEVASTLLNLTRLELCGHIRVDKEVEVGMKCQLQR